MIISTSPGFLRQNFISQTYLIRDTSPLSPNFFDITLLPEQIGGGVSLIKLRGNEDNLAFDKPTQVEILDAQGTPVRHEIATHIDRFQNYYISVYVYDTTAPGIGSISIVGVAKREPRGEIIIDPNTVNDLGHNVIWTRPITILPNARNSSELVFDDPPFVSVAQVIVPARVSFNADVNTQYSAITASSLTIATSRFKGFDKKRGSNYAIKNGIVKKANKDKIVDNKAKSTNINVDSEARTVNYVEAPTRIEDPDVIGGFILKEETRYNTTLIASESFFSSSYIGGVVGFFTNSYTLNPLPPSNYDFSNTNPYDDLQLTGAATQSLDEQLARWKANIVKIKNDRIAYIDQPVQANLRRTDFGTNSRGYETKHTFYDVSTFTSSILYTPDSLLYTTSSEVSQSYLQFTIQDLNPIGGLVDKIRVYYRRGSEVGDWEMLQDQIITPVEYLTDARYPNQTNYGLDISDYYLLGHFTDQTVIDDNWSVMSEQATTFDTATASLDNSILLNSVRLECSASISKILTTRYYQNYAEDSVYTLSFNCILGPYTQLELYENSSTLQTTVFGSDPFPRAFDKTQNYQILTYSDRFNRYGKLIGKVANNTNIAKDYTRVVFDFKTDRDGLGRPMFRVRQTNSPTTSSAHISQVSVTPRQLVGFTPKTVQFAFPAKLDTNIDLNETIDYKLEYYDYTGNQSEYVTYLEDIRMELQTEIPTTACQTEQKKFTFTPAWWVNFQTQSPPHSEIWSTQNMLSGSFSSTTRWIPSFVNTLLLNGINIQTAVNTGVPWAQIWATASNQGSGSLFTPPTIGWNVAIPVNGLYYGAATTPTFQLISSSTVVESQGQQFTEFKQLGAVTSSWQYADRFVLDYNESFSYPFPYGGGNAIDAATYCAYPSNSFALPSTTLNFDNIRVITSMSCVGITRAAVSRSYRDYDLASTNVDRTVALKRRRLMYPVTPADAENYFTQNGGIYNVKFKLKRFASPAAIAPVTPDANSYLSVYIFNANAEYTTSSIGRSGWYPPSQNVVKIGNSYSYGGTTTPVISYLDSSTGYYYDEYNINLVQYGTPAQLVFEPSGEGDAFFATLIDDIEFCKIGVTTDPFYTKPLLVASSTITTTAGKEYFPPEK